jgi:DNA-binding MarR family transcriptional regulator
VPHVLATSRNVRSLVAYARNPVTVVGMARATKQDPKKTAASTRWLDEQEMAAWRSFIGTLGPLLHALDSDLAGFGLTHAEYEVLVHLSEQPDARLRMCDLAGQLAISAGGLTRRLDRLVAGGLVAREQCCEDRRSTIAVLTAAGRKALIQAAPTHVAGVRRRFVDVLTPDELGALTSAFAKVQAATQER